MKRFVTLAAVGVLTLAVAVASASAHQPAGRSPARSGHGGQPTNHIQATAKKHQRGTRHKHRSTTPSSSRHAKRRGGNKTSDTTGKAPTKSGKKIQPLVLGPLSSPNSNVKLSSNEQAAVNRVLSGDLLSETDRTSLSDLAVNGREGLTAEQREALNQALVDDSERKQRDVAVQSRRYLRIKNEAGEKLNVYVQYYTVSDQNRWLWFPARPGEAAQAKHYQLDPGEETYLGEGDGHIGARRARLWARSSSGKEWTEYKDQDLWLVSEVDDDGVRRYYAPKMETFTFSFSPD